MTYSIAKEITAPFPEAIERVKAALTAQGFGVLSEIDVRATMKKKLDADMDDYVILGACNPAFALKALRAEPEIGLFLPCNVIVYMKEGKAFASAIRPTVAMGMIENAELADTAREVEEMLARVIADS